MEQEEGEGKARDGEGKEDEEGMLDREEGVRIPKEGEEKAEEEGVVEREEEEEIEERDEDWFVKDGRDVARDSPPSLSVGGVNEVVDGDDNADELDTTNGVVDDAGSEDDNADGADNADDAEGKGLNVEDASVVDQADIVFREIRYFV